MAVVITDRPARVGLFSTVVDADRAIQDLRDAGFATDELAVVCSDKTRAEAFGDLPSANPAGSQAPQAVAAGTAAGAAIGGLALVAANAATAGLALVPSAIVLIGGGALAGAFTGAMAATGTDAEMYYREAVRLGNILVVAEPKGERREGRLDEAERVLARAGAKPVPITE